MFVPTPGVGGGTHICNWYICAAQGLKMVGLGSGPSLKWCVGGGGRSERPLIGKTGDFGVNNNKEM